jgi:hypothetical protein
MAELQPESKPKQSGYCFRVAAHIGENVANRAILQEKKDFTALSAVDLLKAVGIGRRYLQPAIDAACIQQGLKVQTYIPVENHGGYYETSGRFRARVIEDRERAMLDPIEQIADQMAAAGQFVESLYPPPEKPLPQSSTELPDDFMAIHY